jgi:hypothetical protein
MAGIISTPCWCPQPLCLRHYEMELPRWAPGDGLHCFFCRPKTLTTVGEFVRWERL